MITKLEQFSNIASRTITVKNKLVPVEVEFDKNTKEYSIVDQKSISYQNDHQSEDLELERKYNTLIPQHYNFLLF